LVDQIIRQDSPLTAKVVGDLMKYMLAIKLTGEVTPQGPVELSGKQKTMQKIVEGLLLKTDFYIFRSPVSTRGEFFNAKITALH
jgi:hypothetical protein